MHDMLVKGGTIVDGTGRAGFTGDLAVAGGRIVAVGSGLGPARRTLDADGLIVTPGWIDVHTHYDAQATWDADLQASLGHGATTVIMGNCGVGFAPAAPGRRDWLIRLMAGVEDVPEETLRAGMTWGWESFPEYLDALARKPRTIDVGAMITHGALRAYVMGERGARNETPAAHDLERMTSLASEALRAGALGISTSRTKGHRSLDGEPIPGTFADEAELGALASAIQVCGRGLLEAAPAGLAGDDMAAYIRDVDALARLSATYGCPVSFLLFQVNPAPDAWRDVLARCESANAAGARLHPQTFVRPTCTLFSLQGKSPFYDMPAYAPLRGLPLEEQVRALRRPEMRARLVASSIPGADKNFTYSPWTWRNTYRSRGRLSYFPHASDSVAAVAAQRGCSEFEALYDLMLEDDGRAVLLFAQAGYAQQSRAALSGMLRHPVAVLGGSDGGAHVRYICDTGYATFVLTDWVRDLERDHPEHLPLEIAVQKLTSGGARLFGLRGRGTLQPGMKADVNLIDLENLSCADPQMLYDLPAGMPRLSQEATGYVATLVSGEIVQENGTLTGARPGAVVRA
jgi:N-acyl-D-aspartate/D-glutamate deacylase